MNSKFDEYYSAFLDIDNAVKINNIWYIQSGKRDVPLNKEFFYPVILTKYNGKIYLSVSNKYYDIILNSIKAIDFTLLSNNEIICIFQNTFSNILDDFEVKEMYRMCKDKKVNISNSNAVLLNNSTKQYFMNTGNKANDISFKEKKWKQLKYILDSGMIYVVPNNNKIVSMAFTSDVYNKGANIVVTTNEDYRRKGYGKMAVALLTNSILEKDLLPIYFVNINNEASINLAKSLEYENMVQEIVVCIKR